MPGLWKQLSACVRQGLSLSTVSLFVYGHEAFIGGSLGSEWLIKTKFHSPLRRSKTEKTVSTRKTKLVRMDIAPIPSAVCCKISNLQNIKPIIVTYLSTQCVVRKFSPYSNLLSSYGNKEKKPKEVEEQQLEQKFILWVCLGCPKKDLLQLHTTTAVR